MTAATASLLARLNDLWRAEFPLTRALQIEAQDFSAHQLTTFTPLLGNTNVHQSAFAGSLYAAQALTAWGAIWLELETRQLRGSIIHAHADISYQRQVGGDFQATCDLKPHLAELDALQRDGKARFDLTAQVFSGETLACQLTGNYAIRLAA